MAAVTPSATYVENIGSMKLTIATFAATTDAGDTWASGLTEIVAYWAVSTGQSATKTTNGVGVAESSGTFTLYCEQDNIAITLFVISRGM